METINTNPLRIGNITSSEIVALTSNGKAKGDFGKPFYTYVEECNYERKLQRSISNDVNSRPTSWGTLLESQVFYLLGIEYQLASQQTLQHPTIPYWTGSPDVIKSNVVGDVKCPNSLKSFCQLVEPIYNGLNGIEAINHIRDNHKDGDKYYWQLVSNAIITNSTHAELIVYVPYKSELADIKELAANFDGDQNKYAWINFANDDDLPYLVDGGYYKNLNKISFEVPESDKDFLTSRVLSAGKLLN